MPIIDHLSVGVPDIETGRKFHDPLMQSAGAQCLAANGGKDEGAPGQRDAYPMPDVYTGYVPDPFGNKLEIIHNGFSS